jgi:hypothetical protein
MTPERPPRRVLRRAAAVLGGFLATAVLSVATDAVLHAAGVFPPGPHLSDRLLGLALAYRVVYAIAGGAVTAALAPARPMAHARVLAALGQAGGIAGVVANQVGQLGPAWYPLAIAATAVPCVWAGARLRESSGAGRSRAAPGVPS